MAGSIASTAIWDPFSYGSHMRIGISQGDYLEDV